MGSSYGQTQGKHHMAAGEGADPSPTGSKPAIQTAIRPGYILDTFINFTALPTKLNAKTAISDLN